MLQSQQQSGSKRYKLQNKCQKKKPQNAVEFQNTTEKPLQENNGAGSRHYTQVCQATRQRPERDCLISRYCN